MRICENGVYRDMTAEEIAAMQENAPPVEKIPADPLTAMAQAMAGATSLEQMRAAAQAFLDNTATK